MKDVFNAVKVADRVYWVGAIDWDIRDFHGYRTSRGTTYNAFLILADKITLIDAVKASFTDEMLGRIGSVIDPSAIDYIVSNHSELDHSGGLPEAIRVIEPEKVFASSNGVKTLAAHFHDGMEVTAVEEGRDLSLGNMGLSFVEMRMCHWPDSMATYLHEGQVLFSQDVFGMHMASSARFADEIDKDTLRWEAAKYYANILTPLSPFVRQTLMKIRDLGLKFRMIAPDHGPLWRRDEDMRGIVHGYALWAAQKKAYKVAIVYDTMWGSTATMARAICEGLVAAGVTVRLMSMDACHRSDMATELLDSAALLVGSPTFNSTLYPTVADAMSYLKGLKPQNLVAAAFGSFGWSGEAPKELHAALVKMGAEMIAKPVRVKYVPDAEALGKCRELGTAVAEALQKKIRSPNEEEQEADEKAPQEVSE